ncbi:hypothetical protein OG439_02515 [Amycolatopsis sp. NBC_01307]|uniref:hypothetical protein n=1 Tax=Amycolatopsis sp. NBC_01307 TaxID=2903561 RepID=UPI002E1564E5|nr:hypothetical protein OG439_02515 [Amycolatopsis sp. NBC_01307]
MTVLDAFDRAASRVTGLVTARRWPLGEVLGEFLVHMRVNEYLAHGWLSGHLPRLGRSVDPDRATAQPANQRCGAGRRFW